MRFIFSILFLFCGISVSAAADTDSLMNYTLEQVQVSAPIKMGRVLRSQAVSYTSINQDRMEKERINSLKEASLIVPNLYIPDYGSSMTSSIYVRGLGTRIDNPVIGLYIDGVPYMNKNNFDFNLFDIARMEIIRGPQGTLFGRNAMGGVVNIHTLSPLDFQGTRFAVEYGSGMTFSARVAYYARLSQSTGITAGGYCTHSDGFYTNSYNGDKCDDSDNLGMRIRFDYRRRNTIITATAAANNTRQGGFPYSMYDPENDRHYPISYNDNCGYRRENFTAGLNVEHRIEKIAVSNTLSYQYTDDKMTLDQDFTPKSMFTLSQAQKEHAISEEVVVRSNTARRYQWLIGAFAFYKHLRTSAPVTFKQDGIRELIEDNINKGLQTVFESDSIDIRQDEFALHSDFTNPTLGTALFHTSTLRLGSFTLCLGVRFDYERSTLRYDSRSQIDYLFSATMSDYKSLVSNLKGNASLSYFEILPKLSATYEFGTGGNVYVSAAKGYKAGGFNTQMFSDFLQSRLQTDLMKDLGMRPGGNSSEYDIQEAMSYRPEYCWNYEIGTHLNLASGCLKIDASAFYIDCRDQQITVFPSGMTTGRMMRNAGKTRSIGAEVSLDARPYRGLHMAASYGYTDARFIEYDDGKQNYKGKYVPYAPKNTLSLSVDYRIDFASGIDALIFGIGCNAVGKIYWDDANTVSQPFYGLLSARITVVKGAAEIDLWGKNLSGQKYDTFYFQSIGNRFVQRGKPMILGISVRFNLKSKND